MNLTAPAPTWTPPPFSTPSAANSKNVVSKAKPISPSFPPAPHANKPRRHILRIKAHLVVGFSVQVTQLTAEESVRLQEDGLGGRGRMGCGFFVAAREGKS